MKFTIFCLLTIIIFANCQMPQDKEAISNPGLEEIVVPTQASGAPNLFVSPIGQVYLSWVEYLNDTTDALLFSTLENGVWTAPKTIATGTNWFVNWADFPSLVAHKDQGKTLTAHWLQKSAEGTYDYDVHIAQSIDGGSTWGASFIPHRDSIAAEHGFVSMLPLSGEKVFATWLDGRNTKGEAENNNQEHGHGHHGAMTLRAAVFDKDNKLSQEAELDERICDCCQTAVAQTDVGIIVAYRDRSEKEIRDISVVRKVNGKWTEPKTVSEDNWHITGCPVNGPALAAAGNQVALAWFTMSGEQAQVKLTISRDNGASFSEPIIISKNKPLGRVDVVWGSEDDTWVSWLEERGKGAVIKLARVQEGSIIGPNIIVAETSAARQSGFPRMVRNNDQLIFAWTHVEENTQIKSGIINLNKF